MSVKGVTGNNESISVQLSHPCISMAYWKPGYWPSCPGLFAVLRGKFLQCTEQSGVMTLNHSGHRLVYVWVSQVLTGSDNGSSPLWRHANILTNASLLLVWPLRTEFGDMNENKAISTQEYDDKISSAKSHPICLGLKSFDLAPGKVESWHLGRMHLYYLTGRHA